MPIDMERWGLGESIIYDNDSYILCDQAGVGDVPDVPGDFSGPFY